MSSKRAEWHPILEDFARHLVCDNKSENTIKTYKYRIQNMLDWTNKEPEELTQEDLDGFKYHLRSALNESGDRRYDDNSLMPFAGAINQFMPFLKKENMKFIAPPGRDKPIIPLTTVEILRMVEIAKAKRDRDHALICTLYYGALRITDLLNLNLEDIDFDRKKLRIYNSKGGYSDEINLHQVALDSLQRYIESEREGYKNGSDAVFISEKKGTRLTRNPVWKMVKECAVKAEITKKVNTHIFRHSMLTHMAQNKATIPEIMRQSRHRDVKSVMKYLHLGDSVVEDAYNRTALDIYIEESSHEDITPEEDEQSIEPIDPGTMIPNVNDEVNGNDMLETALSIFKQGQMTEATFNRMLDMIDSTSSTKKSKKIEDDLDYFA